MKTSATAGAASTGAVSILTGRIKFSYALGQLGWSILSGLIQVWLVWFYNPPSTVPIPAYIPRGAVLGFLTVIGLITMAGRFTDAITDPWIAALSDASRNPKGRRIPFMAKASIPFAGLAVLVFCPPAAPGSWLNIVWLAVTLLSYYVFYTLYVAPYFALTSELGKTAADRIDLSTWIALTWFVGYIIASAAAYIWPVFQSLGFDLPNAIRLTFGLLALLALGLMLVPVIVIDERKFFTSNPVPVDFARSARRILGNRNFLVFEIFFLAYGIAITIFQTGNVYYVTVLLGMGETWVTLITAASGILAFMLYPAVNVLSKRFGKKILCAVAMVMLIIAYGWCSLLGMLPFPVIVQAGIFVLFAAVGFAVFGILPNAIVADFARADAQATGDNMEGMYFALQTFMSKMGQMIAMLLFGSMLLLGKERGADLGVRMTGVAAAVIGIVALLIFSQYRNSKEAAV